MMMGNRSRSLCLLKSGKHKNQRSGKRQFHNLTKDEWKGVLNVIENLTLKLESLSNEKKSKKKSVKKHTNTLTTSRSSRSSITYKVKHQNEIKHEDNCSYLKQYQKLKLKNQRLTIQKQTLQKMLMNKTMKNCSKTTKQKQSVEKNPLSLKRQFRTPIANSRPIINLQDRYNKKNQEKPQDLLFSKSDLTVKEDSEQIVPVTARNDHNETIHNIKLFGSVNKKEKTKQAELGQRQKLNKQFERLLSQAQAEKNKERKKMIRKEMQEIAQKLKTYKQQIFP